MSRIDEIKSELELDGSLGTESANHLLDLLAQAAEVIRWYGDRENHQSRSVALSCGCCSSFDESAMGRDDGKRAREFLARMEGEK